MEDAEAIAARAMRKADGNQTWIDLVAEHAPSVHPGARGFVLWNYTCFPCGTEEHVIANLRHFEEVGQEAADAEQEAAYQDMKRQQLEELTAEAQE